MYGVGALYRPFGIQYGWLYMTSCAPAFSRAMSYMTSAVATDLWSNSESSFWGTSFIFASSILSNSSLLFSTQSQTPALALTLTECSGVGPWWNSSPGMVSIPELSSLTFSISGIAVLYFL